jgi:hypothetical protein
MLIKTKEFALSQEDFIILSMLNLVRSWGILHVMLFFFSLIAAIIASNLVFLVVLLFLWILLPLLYGAFFLQQAYSKNNEAIFRKRYYDITEEFVTGYAEDDSSERTRTDFLIRAVSMLKYYLLYTSGNSFYVIPREAFQNEGDRQNFEGLLRAKGLRR